MPQKAYRFETVVRPDGKVELDTALLPGTAVEVLVLTTEQDEFADLLSAANSSMDFWNNPEDEADWNHA